VVLRFKDGWGPDGPTSDDHKTVRGLPEHEFIQIAHTRANAPFWRGIESIQTCIKTKKGLGERIPVLFRCEKVMEVDHIFDEENFDYDFHKYGEPYAARIQAEARRRGADASAFSYVDMQREIERRMKEQDPRQYCWRIANKVAFYVQKLYDQDILRMDLEFFKDENGDIWMAHAEGIVVKNNKCNTKTQKLTGVKLRGQQILSNMMESMEKEGLLTSKSGQQPLIDSVLQSRSAQSPARSPLKLRRR